MVVTLIYIGELAFSGLLPAVRFSLGFYAGRVFSIIASSIVLIILGYIVMVYWLFRGKVREGESYH